MKPMRTERLILRNWEERDRALFHRINSDERVMEFFPFRRDRATADAKMDEFRSWIAEDGYGFAAAEIAATGECIGFVGLLKTD
ncbi:MAG: GNAT family N-acetyltransferase, partial [Mesorhizobium sp.]